MTNRLYGLKTWAFTGWMCVVTGIAGFLATPLKAAPGSPERPNIIFIISDDQSWTDYSFMGHPHIETPAIDKLSRESLLFGDGYVTSSLCCPSLATIITGLYPCQHKITGNEPPAPAGITGQQKGSHPEFLQGRIEMDEIMRDTETLPKTLRKHGYRSFQSGKWWHGSYELAGFDEGMTHGDPKRGGRHGDEGLKIGRTGLDPMFNFIEKDDSKPFFIWYAPFLPHTPHNPPAELLAKYEGLAPTKPIAKYWAMCEWFDQTCGEITDYLDDNDLRKNTVILYVTDNGWINQRNASRYAPRSKRSPYDGGLRTPIMVNWPGRIKPSVSSHLASSIDLVPTVLDIIDAPQPERLQGISLTNDAALSKRHVIQGAVYLHDARSIHQPYQNLTFWWARNKTHKIIIPFHETQPGAGIELYNLKSDPMEITNIAGKSDHHHTASLTSHLFTWWGNTYLK